MLGNNNNSTYYYHYLLIAICAKGSEVRLYRLLLHVAIGKTSANCLQINYYWQRKDISTEINGKDL